MYYLCGIISKWIDMYKVICFARVSTTAQDLQPQIEAVKKAILYDGYMESEILYVQGKESAIKLKEEERQTLNEMKQLVEENPTIESVYFFAVDRLARRMSIVMSVKEWADERKLNLVFLSPHAMHTFRRNEKGEWVEDELTTLLLAMLSYGASMEMKVKKARFETAKEAMRLQGKLVQGNPLKGYCLDKDRNILIDEVEAELVRDLFNDYLHGEYTLTTLHSKYAKKGLFEPNINRSTIKVRIHSILNNTAYSGNPKISNYCKKHGKEHKIHYPPIISEELHQQVLDKLHSM